MSVVGFLVCFEWDSFKRKQTCEERKENAEGRLRQRERLREGHETWRRAVNLR